MGKIVNTPTQIHTVFNPVKVVVQPVSESAASATLTITPVTSDDFGTISLTRDYLNRSATFNISHALKNLFKDEQVAFTGIDRALYFDKRLAMHYHLQADGGEMLSRLGINAVVQCGHNPDMALPGNRFLTNFDVLRKFEGYPLDVSYLLAGGNAYVSFNGTTLNLDNPLTESHLSMSVPDGVTSVIVSDKPLTVDLLSNVLENIQDNRATGFVVVNPVKAAIVVEKAVPNPCTPGSPFYVRWVNRNGSFDHWMFYRNQTISRSAQTKNTFEPLLTDIEQATFIQRELSKETEYFVTVGAGNLTPVEYEAIAEVITAPYVAYWNMELQKWIQIFAEDADLEILSGDKSRTIEIDFKLPTPQIQF